MSTDARHLILNNNNHGLDDFVTEFLLKLLRHVVTELSDTVNSGISNFRVGVLQVLEHDLNHWSNSVNILNVLSNLTESHKGSILVSPVLVMLEQLLHNNTQMRKADLVANSSNDVVNTGFAEVEIVSRCFTFAGNLFFEALFGSQPVLFNINIDINHKLENELKKFFEEGLIVLNN